MEKELVIYNDNNNNVIVCDILQGVGFDKATL